MNKIPIITDTGAIDFSQCTGESLIALAEQGKSQILALPEQLLSNEIKTASQFIKETELSLYTLRMATSMIIALLEAKSTPEIRAAGKTIVQMAEATSAQFFSNKALFEKFNELCKTAALDTEESVIAEYMKINFEDQGATLEPELCSRLHAVSEKLSLLQLQFTENVVEEMDQYGHFINDAAELEGVPEDILESMQTADTPPRWKLNLTSSTYIPIMQYCKVRSTREHLYRAKESLCCKGGKFDNMELMDQILSLRAERATLSKHSCYLNYVLKDRMVKNAQTLEEFFNTLKSSLKQPVLNIRHKLEQLALSDGLSKLESWDIHYYKRILKNENFPFDEQEFRPYFEFQSTMKGVFKLCEELFGIKVEAQGTADAFHPDITVYKVYSKNELKGWLYVDPYARAAKSQGAWALSYTPQSNDFSLKPHVGIHFNFSPPTKTQPSLLVFSDVLTVFHEFGHALHGLLSNVRYPSSEGMNVALDFVELPSQLLENFAWEIPMIQSMASHYQTGEPIPESMLKQLKDSSSYDRDWGAARTAAFALMDKKLHETATLPEDLRKLEAECNEEFGMLPMPEQCYFLPTFDHVFGGEYAAGYYSYLWAEVLDADVFDAYKNSKNPKEFAKTYRDTILSAGSSRKEDESYRILMGREPDSKAFLKRILS